MRRFLAIVILFLIVILSIPRGASAHGSGPPYLKVNGKYAPTNQSVLAGDSRMSMGLDLSPDDKYLVNTPISFEIDLAYFPVSEELRAQMEYRWRWDAEDTNYSYGLKTSHMYSQPGSHFVIIEARLITEPQYTAVNSVKIDVVPHMEYQLPQAKIGYEGQVVSEKEVSFKSDVTLDKSASVVSYLWKLDDGIYKTESNPKYAYTVSGFFIKQIVLQVIDSNGFVSHGFLALSGTPGDTSAVDPKKDKVVYLSTWFKIWSFVLFFVVPPLAIIGGYIGVKKILARRKKGSA